MVLEDITMKQLVERAVEICRTKDGSSVKYQGEEFIQPMTAILALVEAYNEIVGSDTSKASALLADIGQNYDQEKLDFNNAEGSDIADFVVSLIIMSRDVFEPEIIAQIPDYEEQQAKRRAMYPDAV